MLDGRDCGSSENWNPFAAALIYRGTEYEKMPPMTMEHTRYREIILDVTNRMIQQEWEGNVLKACIKE